MSHTGGGGERGRAIVDHLKPDYTVLTDGAYISKMDIPLEQFCAASNNKCLHSRSSELCNEYANLVATT